LFAYLLLLRAPLEGEEADIDAALAPTRRRWLTLLAAYAGVLYLTVWPAFSTEHDFRYRVLAVLFAHVLLWFVVSIAATSWVGFRFGSEQISATAIIVFVGVVAGLLVSASILYHVVEDWGRAAASWWDDTFSTTIWISLALVLAVYVLPDLIAQLR